MDISFGALESPLPVLEEEGLEDVIPGWYRGGSSASSKLGAEG